VPEEKIAPLKIGRWFQCVGVSAEAEKAAARMPVPPPRDLWEKLFRCKRRVVQEDTLCPECAERC
jgi:hypothetical protein